LELAIARIRAAVYAVADAELAIFEAETHAAAGAQIAAEEAALAGQLERLAETVAQNREVWVERIYRKATHQE